MVVSDRELGLRKRYWEQVRECLVRFHSYPKEAARKAVTELQKKFPLSSSDPSVEILYHSEAFGVACEISGKVLKLKDYATQYREILFETEFPGKTPMVREARESIVKSIRKTFDQSDGNRIKKEPAAPTVRKKNSSETDTASKGKVVELSKRKGPKVAKARARKPTQSPKKPGKSKGPRKS
jgi:hypothetical protein